MSNEIIKIIYDEIKLNPKITENYLAKKYHYSERTVRRYIKQLKEEKKIMLVGFGRKKRWKIL